MNQKIRSLITAISALVTCTQANCLIETETYGIEKGQRFSNYDEIEQLGSDQFVMKSFKTCEDNREDMVGLQFTLVDKDDASNTVKLAPMGDVSDSLDCRELTISSGPIVKILASYSQNDKAISGIRYYNSNTYVMFGKLISPYEEWVFDDKNVLIGAQGWVKDGMIIKLGFVVHTTDDSLCMVEEDVDVGPVVEEPPEEEPVVEQTQPEAEP